MTAPTICAVIIARNEARDIPKAIASLKGVADHLVVVDTGSTDHTIPVARDAWEEFNDISRIITEYYFDASEPNPDRTGEYRIVNFSKARNRAIEIGEMSGCSHILWLDADDRIITPLAFRRAPYYPDAVIGCWIELGGTRQLHHRMWPAKYKVRFSGWVHEWPDISAHPVLVLNDAMIQHDATPHESAGEDSNQRNMRILTAQNAAEPNARSAFYLGNTHRDGSRFKDAVEWYQKRLDYGEGFRDEYLFTMLYMARCQVRLEQWEDARKTCIDGLKRAPDWQEFRMEIAQCYYKQKRYQASIKHASMALDKPIHDTVLWREKDKYLDQPARLISWCHEHLGNLVQALVWSQMATRLIGNYDADWAKREAVLEQRLNAPVPATPAINHHLRERIALHRPGAIGDILMTLNLVPAFKEAHPGIDLHYYCAAQYAKPEQLGAIIAAAGCDLVGASEHLNRKQYDRVIDLVGYPIDEGYPERPMEWHLLHYFEREMFGKVSWSRGGLPSLTLRRPMNRVFTSPPSYATLQTAAGWSKYKQWAQSNWDQLIEFCDFPIVRIDEKQGWTLSQSIAVFANARMHIGIDSFCNHLTNYTWTDEHGGRRVPGVILWGSTQASAAGYPDNMNISKGVPCQPCFRENPAISRTPREPCLNVVDSRDPPIYCIAKSYDDPRPHACMDQISVEEVVEAVRTMWQRQSSQSS